MMSIAIAAAFAFAIAVGVAVGLCMRNNGWAEALFGCAVIAVIFAAMCGVLYLAGVGNSASTATNMETAQRWLLAGLQIGSCLSAVTRATHSFAWPIYFTISDWTLCARDMRISPEESFYLVYYARWRVDGTVTWRSAKPFKWVRLPYVPP
jgi:hypothetical protein